jgi:hypothetical protein
MTIPEQVSKLFEHPYFKQAVRQYSSGNTANLEYVFSAVMVHTHQTTRGECIKEYRRNKWFNFPEIVTAMKELAFPANINYELPIPQIEDEPICRVVPLMVVKRHPKINHTPNQLELAFPNLNKASRILQEA